MKPIAAPSQHVRRTARSRVICLCAALAYGSWAQGQIPFAVTWMNDRLSVRASEAPLADVVSEVARFTGLKVVGADKLQGRLTVDFADLPIVDALKTLLADVNYFIQQEPGADKGRIGLVLRVHSMARMDPDGAAAGNSFMRLPALVTLLELEAEEIADEKQEEEDDPDVAEEHKQYLHTAQQLVASGEFGGAASVSTLERYASNENPEIRLEAVKALSQRPIAAVLPLLLEALADDSIEVRQTAINALGRVSDRESLQKVGLLLEKSDDISVRYGALRILALRADPAAIVHLQNVADDGDLTIHDGARQMLAEFERLGRAKKPPFR